MFEHPNLIALRGFVAAVALAVIAGCGGGANVAAPGSGGTSTGTTEVPAVPMGLQAAAGNSQVSLTWSASSGATSYNVKRSTTTGGPYAQLAAMSSPSYTDGSVTNGTAYFYVVSAINSVGESADSTQASATPDPTITTPSVPVGLKATAGNAQASLTWTASSGATSYHVKRATVSGGPYTQVAAPTTASYTNTSLTNGTTYYYVVSALDSAGESANSAQVSALPVAATSIPAAPAGLSATPGNAQVMLSWSASSGATSYHVKRATATGGPYTQVASPTSASYTDTSLTNGTTYYYVVSALDSAGESANTGQISAKPAAPASQAPAAPSGVAASGGNAQVVLNWSASSGATSYHVKRATVSGGPYSQVAAPTATSYTDPSLTNGTTYYYVVSALNATGESANSSQATATPAAPTPPPTSGTWVNVTPASANLTSNLDCSNYGAESVQADTANPGTIYTQFNCQGIWKSTDYGQTWTGPINTGTNGACMGDGAGGITINPSATPGGAPTIYASNIRSGNTSCGSASGGAMGFWVSTDGGVNWTNYPVLTSLGTQDYYVPVIDPYDRTHLLMPHHEADILAQSIDGGHTWTSIPYAAGMKSTQDTGQVVFINTGTAATTRTTWLWIGQQSGGTIGMWRTTNSGSTWTQVDRNEHTHGGWQPYQPGTAGVIFAPGQYSSLGDGLLYSNDYGVTWSHVGLNEPECAVVATSKGMYAGYAYPIGIGQTIAPNFENAGLPGTGTWTAQPTPSGMTQGPPQFAVLNDGTHNILVTANFNAGLWRYVEP